MASRQIGSSSANDFSGRANIAGEETIPNEMRVGPCQMSSRFNSAQPNHPKAAALCSSSNTRRSNCERRLDSVQDMATTMSAHMEFSLGQKFKFACQAPKFWVISYAFIGQEVRPPPSSAEETSGGRLSLPNEGHTESIEHCWEWVGDHTARYSRTLAGMRVAMKRPSTGERSAR